MIIKTDSSFPARPKQLALNGSLVLPNNNYEPTSVCMPRAGQWPIRPSLKSVAAAALVGYLAHIKPVAGHSTSRTVFQGHPLAFVLNDRARHKLVEAVETLDEFKSAVVDETDRLVAVKFFSKSCRACAAMAQHFERMAAEYPEVKFVEVPLTRNNAMLHTGLGISKIPTGHIYHPQAGLVEERSLNRNKIKDFEGILNDYIVGSCDLPEEELTRV